MQICPNAFVHAFVEMVQSCYFILLTIILRLTHFITYLLTEDYLWSYNQCDWFYVDNDTMNCFHQDGNDFGETYSDLEYVKTEVCGKYLKYHS